MEEIFVDINEDVVSVIKKLKRAKESSVKIVIAEGSVIFENLLNIKLIKKLAGDFGKDIAFETEDEFGRNMLESLDGNDMTPAVSEITFSEPPLATSQTSLISSRPKESSSRAPARDLAQRVKSIKLPHINFSLKFGNFKIFLFIVPPLLIVFGIFYFLFFVLPKASVTVLVSSEALVKSTTIKMSTSVSSVDSTLKIIPGRIADSTDSFTGSSGTTGSKTVGEKATGEVTVYNKTDEDKKFSKGTVLTLVSSKDSLKFTTDLEITVPKRVLDSVTNTYENQKKTVGVTAQEFGSKYNLPDGKSFKVGTNDTENFIAENSDSFSGGSSKTVKAVSQTDKDNLSASVFEKSKSELLTTLKSKLSADEKLIESTVRYKKDKEVFDRNIADESDKLSLTSQISATGVFYKQSDLQNLLDSLTARFVPEGFKVSQKDSNTEVGVLDTLTGAVVPSEFNLEVKMRARIEPVLDAKNIEQGLRGRSVEDAKNYLSKIKNIKSYTINMWPKFALASGKLPSGENKIEVVIQKEK